MDLSSKLNYYKQQAKNTRESESTISASLKALQEHFDGEILFDPYPVLKISKSKKLPAFHHKNISINLISKNEFTEPVPREKCVFFDLETTGLAGGAGTFAFLLGFAYWEDENLITEQFFLPDFGREYDLFIQLQEWLSRFDYIVSYNGKSYDMPLLSNRFVLNRVKADFKKYYHIDLIHMCRRIWKESMASCTLKSVEQYLLNIVRSNDIPGALIPQAYFSFVNTGVIHDVIRMIEHNHQDIISLPLIFNQLHFIEHNPRKLGFDENALSSLAKIAFEINYDDYFRMIEELPENEKPVDARFKFWKSLFFKKNEQWDEAFTIWQEIRHKPEFCFVALEESAKYLEHKQKDIDAAIKIVDSAFKRLDLQKELGYQLFEPEWQERFEKRRQRLLKKLRS